MIKLPNGSTCRRHQDQVKSCREQVTAPTQNILILYQYQQRYYQQQEIYKLTILLFDIVIRKEHTFLQTSTVVSYPCINLLIFCLCMFFVIF